MLYYFFFVVVCTFKASLLQTFVILEPFALMHFKKVGDLMKVDENFFVCPFIFYTSLGTFFCQFHITNAILLWGVAREVIQYEQQQQAAGAVAAQLLPKFFFYLGTISFQTWLSFWQ